MLTRRALNTAAALSSVSIALTGCAEKGELLDDVSALNTTRVDSIHKPISSTQIAALLKESDTTVSIGGSRHSMGGHTLYPDSMHLDLTALKQLVWLDVTRRCVRVQAGMRWRDLQQLIDPHDLSVAIMQSYSNFTVGGSVSVNVHGRYRGLGAIIESVRALQLITAKGEVLELSPQSQPELFYAVIGGYGLLGVVSEVELTLAQNERIAREVVEVPLNEYPRFFAEHAHTALLHNADVIAPVFDHVLAVNWRSTAAPLTQALRLVPENINYSRAQNEIWSASEFPIDQWTRERRIAAMKQPAVVWRNYEASLDVDALEPRTRSMSTYLLQEYFLPEHALVEFVQQASAVLLQHRVNLLNISIRHAAPDLKSLMSWSRTPVFCAVLYYKQRSSQRADRASEIWAKELIHLALQLGGSYYLPYRLHASIEQFRRAYPNWRQLLTLKARLDPESRFRNQWSEKYLTE
jgi:FAD/FMN-containing dehydrogenase